MTQHEQDAAIGELTRRLADAKRRRIAVGATLERAGTAIREMARDLNGVTYAVTLPTVSPDYPDRATLTQLLTDLHRAVEEIEHCTRQLKDAGVDLG